MEKKGQVTLFIILGLVILIIVASLVYYKLSSTEKEMNLQEYKAEVVPEGIVPVKNLIDNCVKDISMTGMSFVMLQGGYYEPQDAINLEGFDIAYWYKNKDVSPSLASISNEIATYINKNLNFCVSDITGDFSIVTVSPKSSVNIQNNAVYVDVDYPAIISYKDMNFIFGKTSIKLDSNLYDIYNTAKGIVKKESGSSMIDMSYLSDIEYNITLFPYSTDVVYGISGDVTLMFANKI